MTPSPSVTAVVLCGGASRRFGSDKTRAELAGRPVLDHVLDGLPPDWPVVCVGPQRPTERGATWVREDPPGGGPAAAVAAALQHVRTPAVVVLGGDMPYAAGGAPALLAALLHTPDAEAVVARDGDGRLQPLLAAYRTDALRTALPDPPGGVPMMRLLDALRVVPAAVEGAAVLDVDTPEDLERARHRLDP